MKKKIKQQKNSYLPERLKTRFSHIVEYPLTLIEAPSGFGKTTSLKEYLKIQEIKGANKYWHTCFGKTKENMWKGIIHIISQIANIDEKELKDFEVFSEDSIFNILLFLNKLSFEKEIYAVVDNFYLMDCESAYLIIDAFSNHQCSNLHFVFITRSVGFKERFLLNSNNIYFLNSSNFFFSEKDIMALSRLYGIRLGSEHVKKVFLSTDGWIDAIKQQIDVYKETGCFLYCCAVESLAEVSIWNELTDKEKELLISVSVMDSFTSQQAAFMLGKEVLPIELESFLNKSEFIQKGLSGCSYKIKNILKFYLNKRFHIRLTKNEKNEIYFLAGKACERKGDYYRAAVFFFKIKDFHSILTLPFSGEYFDSQNETYKPEFIEEIIRVCPEDILCEYPFTMIIFGYKMVLSGKLTAYERLSSLLIKVIEKEKGCEREDAKIIEGELIILKSLAYYNDIPKNIGIQKTALDVLQTPSQMIKHGVPSIFGCISALSFFWNKQGTLTASVSLLKEVESLRVFLMDGYGDGLSALLEAEMLLMRGDDENAEIMCYKAFNDAKAASRISLILCAELVLARINILRGNVEQYLKSVQRIKDYENKGELYVKRISEQCISYLNLSLDLKDNVSQWLFNMEDIKKVVYKPVLPLVQMLYLKILLLENRHNEFFGVFESILEHEKVKNQYQYIIVRLCGYETAALAKYKDGKTSQAQQYLDKAITLALEDKIYLPLVEHFSILEPLFESAKSIIKDSDAMSELIKLGQRQSKGKNEIIKAVKIKDSPLTPREREVALLAKKRMSAREIAEILYISEKTVRTMLKSVYSKLEIHSKYELIKKEF